MEDSLKQKIETLIQTKDVFLFMKGSPQSPMCGFSAGVVNVLNSLNVEFGSFNVLSDESIRQGIKEFANWPTIPQLYIRGEFIGGFDIVNSMVKSGDLQNKINLS